MLSVKAVGLSALAAITPIAVLQPSATEGSVDPSYFEGRWALGEACDEPTNWTLLAGGNFVSEDLIGKWQWSAGQLTLNLTDLAVDEETGEAGGRFQMDGPVSISGPDEFVFTIEPDRYTMKRCP